MNTLVNCELAPVNNFNPAPFGRSGHRIVHISGNIYVIGGYTQFPSGLEVVGEIWEYNILSMIWRKLVFTGDSFTLALSTAVLALNFSILIHGGTGVPFGNQIDNSLTILDLKKETCKSFPSIPKDGNEDNIPLATYGHSLTHVFIDNSSMLFKIGGACGIPYTSNVYAYSFEEQNWELFYRKLTAGEQILPERYRHDTMFWKDQLYIIGGGNSDEILPFWPMPVFDIRKRSWSFVSFSGECPQPLRCSCSVQMNEIVYTTGGVELDQTTLNKNVFTFNLETLTFSIVGTHISPSFFHDLAAIPKQNKFYSFGGVCGQNRVNSLHLFNIMNQPISLIELAWSKFSARTQQIFFPPNLNSLNFESSTGDCLQNHLRSGFFELYSTVSMSINTHQGDGMCLAYSNETFFIEPTKRLFNYIKHAYLSLLNQIENEVEILENVSLYIVVFFYYIGIPLEFIARLPYGFRCLQKVVVYAERQYHESLSSTTCLFRQSKRTLLSSS